jgi:hypothetical protein
MFIICIQEAYACKFIECLIIALARLVRAEPSLLSELKKLPSRAWLGSLNHRAAPARLGSFPALHSTKESSYYDLQDKKNYH